MGKLRLELEGIEVESFPTSVEAAWRGTVRGNGELDGLEVEIGDGEITPPPPPRTVPPDASCDTCAKTCETACTCITYFGACGCT
jgi:hypothetical protein